MASPLRVDARRAVASIVRRYQAGRSVLNNPMQGKLGKATAKIMRNGPRGVKDQFRDQTEYLGAQAIPWEKTKPFGTKKAPRKTMLGTKSYRTSWLGGAGAIEKFTARQVSIGVDANLHPQVKIHQGKSEFTVVKPKEKVKKVGPHYGEWTMRWLLGLTYGVWLTNKRVGMGFKIKRRRISVSNDVKKAVAKLFRDEVQKGIGVKTQGPRGLAA